MHTPIKIIIADDHEIYRKGFSFLLHDQMDINIIAEANNGKELLDQASKLNPDLIITDIKMPEMDGIKATSQLMQLHPQPGIIALTMYNDEKLIIDMLEAGAKGYLMKNITKKELMEAIHTVKNKRTYFSNDTAQIMAKFMAGCHFTNYSGRISSFSKKEIEIIRLICEEYPSKQIASMLGLSIRTVENYREKIQEKTGARNMVGIALFAIKNNIYQIKRSEE
jgi:DNA-binding NarL/FixJ family response regulator